jgi:hypothetical protein
MEEAAGGQPIVVELESQLRLRSTLLTVPGAGECLACYVMRMLDFGCHGLSWALRYRDQTAPRATALPRKLGAMGAYCDCEIFLNAYQPNPTHFALDPHGDDRRADAPLPGSPGWLGPTVRIVDQNAMVLTSVRKPAARRPTSQAGTRFDI